MGNPYEKTLKTLSDGKRVAYKANNIGGAVIYIGHGEVQLEVLAVSSTQSLPNTKKLILTQNVSHSHYFNGNLSQEERQLIVGLYGQKELPRILRSWAKNISDKVRD